jgi:hypothetical protein
VYCKETLKRYFRSQRVADLLPETSRQSAEISGKRGTQIIECNKINVLEKTLNQ